MSRRRGETPIKPRTGSDGLRDLPDRLLVDLHLAGDPHVGVTLAHLQILDHKAGVDKVGVGELLVLAQRGDLSAKPLTSM